MVRNYGSKVQDLVLQVTWPETAQLNQIQVSFWLCQCSFSSLASIILFCFEECFLACQSNSWCWVLLLLKKKSKSLQDQFTPWILKGVPWKQMWIFLWVFVFFSFLHLNSLGSPRDRLWKWVCYISLTIHATWERIKFSNCSLGDTLLLKLN